MSKKSSKTAHVLNLISPKMEDSELNTEGIQNESHAQKSDTERLSQASQSEKEESKKYKPDSIGEILHLSESTESLSELIKDNLEKEFIHNTVSASKIKAPVNNSSASHEEAFDTIDNMVSELETAVLDDIHVTDTSLSIEEQVIEQQPNSCNQNDLAENHKVDLLPLDEDICLLNESEQSSIETLENKKSTEPEADLTSIDSNQQSYNAISNLKPFLPELDISAEPAENLKFYYTNVFERIVKGCVVDYLKRFGVCTCSRCVADTIALALTNLPSKYIVTDYDNVEPLISLYEHKYQVSIMTELTKACFEVDGNPHHKL